jgi:hypothetical protein
MDERTEGRKETGAKLETVKRKGEKKGKQEKKAGTRAKKYTEYNVRL